MTHIEYAQWTGRFRAVIVSLLRDGDEVSIRLAAEAVREYDQIDPRPSMFSALGDHRERAVPCLYCRRDTWSITPVCDRCREAAADVRGQAS